MKALLYQSFNASVERLPDLERPVVVLSPQPRKRTLSWQVTLSYPSPPMSSPPSPQRKLTKDLPATASTALDPDTPWVPTSNLTSHTVSLPPIYEIATTTAGPRAEPWSGRTDYSSSGPPIPSLSTHHSASSSGSHVAHRTESTSSANAIVDLQATAGPSTEATSTNTGGGSRRSKSHVASACSNCKRAHLSCDVERPCNRCVQTGKSVCCLCRCLSLQLLNLVGHMSRRTSQETRQAPFTR
jgi:hypothetical protein